MSEENKTPGKIITFPGGETVDPAELGADYIVSQGGSFETHEVTHLSDLAREYREREDYVSKQELSIKINAGSPIPDLVDSVIKEIGEELAHLKYERKKAARDGKNTANYTISRISSLRSLSDVLMKRMENARAEELDLKSPRFREVMKLWMEFVYESLTKVGVSDQVIDLVFKQMEADMKDWELRIINR